MARWDCMTRLDLVVADDTDDGHAIELPKDLRHISLVLKLVLTQVAPRLKVIWVIAVLDEACRSGLITEHVPTNDGRNSLAVLSAANHHWVDCRHVSCEA